MPAIATMANSSLIVVLRFRPHSCPPTTPEEAISPSSIADTPLRPRPWQINYFKNIRLNYIKNIRLPAKINQPLHSFPLLKLPLSLRIMIYKFAVTTTKTLRHPEEMFLVRHPCDNPAYSADEIRKTIWSGCLILTVCKNFHHEAKAIFYANDTFRFGTKYADLNASLRSTVATRRLWPDSFTRNFSVMKHISCQISDDPYTERHLHLPSAINRATAFLLKDLYQNATEMKTFTLYLYATPSINQNLFRDIHESGRSDGGMTSFWLRRIFMRVDRLDIVAPGPACSYPQLRRSVNATPRAWSSTQLEEWPLVTIAQESVIELSLYADERLSSPVWVWSTSKRVGGGVWRSWKERCQNG